MNLITIIDGLAPYQFVRAEELSESVIQSDHVGAEWLVPDSGEEVPLHVFPVVGGFGMYCSKCHGFYPKEICVHTAAAFLSARSWMCDETDDDTGYEHIIRGNIGELRSILSQGTEYFGCLYASKEIGEVVDRDVCMEFAGTIVGRALRLMDKMSNPRDCANVCLSTSGTLLSVSIFSGNTSQHIGVSWNLWVTRHFSTAEREFGKSSFPVHVQSSSRLSLASTMGSVISL